MLREHMLFTISAQSVGCIKNEFLHGFFKKSEKCLCENLAFCFDVSATEANSYWRC